LCLRLSSRPARAFLEERALILTWSKKSIRSMVRAREISEQASKGIITIPPLMMMETI
jgi:hypothetical protein